MMELAAEAFAQRRLLRPDEGRPRAAAAELTG
jgi:hypothetical protein